MVCASQADVGKSCCGLTRLKNALPKRRKEDTRVRDQSFDNTVRCCGPRGCILDGKTFVGGVWPYVMRISA